MVLYGFLEDFLHGSGTSRCIDDTSLGYGQNTVFADAVVEILGDVGGKWCSRFVTIEPSGYAKTDILFLWVFFHDL